MNPLLIVAGWLIAVFVWCVALGRCARQADQLASRQARLTEFARQVRDQHDLDNAIFEAWAREHALRILQEREQVTQLETLYEAPCADVIPISRARRYSRPDTGSAA